MVESKRNDRMLQLLNESPLTIDNFLTIRSRSMWLMAIHLLGADFTICNLRLLSHFHFGYESEEVLIDYDSKIKNLLHTVLAKR